MIRSFWIFLLQTLLLFSPLYAFEVKVSQSEFCIDNNAIRADLHQVKIEMINTSTTSVTSQTLVIDVFDKLQRTVNFNRFSDLVYHCDYVSINFTTEGDTLTDELVLVYINDRFYKEQKLTVDGKVGKLEDLRIERPLEDSLQIEIFLESSRDNQCLNRVQIQEEGLEFIAPVFV